MLGILIVGGSDAGVSAALRARELQPDADVTQMVGQAQTQVAKRIDILAVALHYGVPVREVLDLDLSYAPPVGSPRDAVQQAVMMWLSQCSSC